MTRSCGERRPRARAGSGAGTAPFSQPEHVLEEELERAILRKWTTSHADASSRVVTVASSWAHWGSSSTLRL